MVVYSENGEKNYVHMINGSGLPVERTLVSILEIHQKNNIVKIPTVLHKYTGFTEIKHEELFVFSNFFEKKK